MDKLVDAAVDLVEGGKLGQAVALLQQGIEALAAAYPGRCVRAPASSAPLLSPPLLWRKPAAPPTTAPAPRTPPSHHHISSHLIDPHTHPQTPSPELGELHNQAALLLFLSGQPDAAARHAEAALDVTQGAFGAAHPLTGHRLLRLASVRIGQGRGGEAAPLVAVVADMLSPYPEVWGRTGLCVCVRELGGCMWPPPTEFASPCPPGARL